MDINLLPHTFQHLCTCFNFLDLVLQMVIYISILLYMWCRGRGSRALLKRFRDGVLIHDASYYGAIQLEGPEVGIPFSL